MTQATFYHLIFDIQAWLNVFFSLTLAYYSGALCKGIARKRPVCIGFTIIGIAWALVYIALALQMTGVDLMNLTLDDGHGYITFSAVTIRPLITLTLATMAIMSVGRYRRMKAGEND